MADVHFNSFHEWPYNFFYNFIRLPEQQSHRIVLHVGVSQGRR